MIVEGVDERMLQGEQSGSSFLVFIYEDGDLIDETDDGPVNSSWSVDSHLLTDADLPRALEWLREHLPANACWSLGVVRQPARPTTGTDIDVDWIVGADVLNMDPRQRDPQERRLAEEMLARRHSVTLA